MGRERILLHPILRFTGTHLLSEIEISRKCLLRKLQHRSKVHRQTQLETRIPILDDFESRVSRIEFWGTVNLLTYRYFRYLWKRQNQKRQKVVVFLRRSIFKSSLFMSPIKCPIVSFFNYKLLTRLSCPLLPLSGPQLALSGLQN